ncbi:hypothetical protein HWV62_9169 [Athelia sp. TMB]|nr:hypothetical protein HWV62_9169 [Athelia sp. TMB]
MSYPYTRRVSTSLDHPPLRQPRQRAQYWRIPRPDILVAWYDPLDANPLVSSPHRRALFLSIPRSPNPKAPSAGGLLQYLGLKPALPPHKPATPKEEAEYARLQREMLRKLSTAEEWERELQSIDAQLRDNRRVIKNAGQLKQRLAKMDRERMVHEKEIWRKSTERMRGELQVVQEGLDYYLHTGPLKIVQLCNVWKPKFQLPSHQNPHQCVSFLLKEDWMF